MVRLRRPTYGRATPTQDESRGFSSPPYMLNVHVGRRAVRLRIAAGTNDYVDVARYGKHITVCTYNDDPVCFGCEVFDLEGQLVTEFFCQGEAQCADCFGQTPGFATWPDWSLSTLFSKLRGRALELLP